MDIVKRKSILKMEISIEKIDNPKSNVVSLSTLEGGDQMSVSKAVRMALKKAGKQNGDLAELWGYAPKAVSNKFAWERWTGKELFEVADLTGGQLAFIYPDGTQITIPQQDPKKEAKAAAKAEAKKAATPAKTKKPASSAKPKRKKAPAKPKKPKEPTMREEQISFFE